MDKTKLKKVNRLNYFINLLKNRFPNYNYINVMTDYSKGRWYIPDDYYIIVRGVDNNESTIVMKFVKEYILYPCIDNNEELPGVITLKN